MTKKSERKRIDFDKFGIFHSHRQARISRPSGGYDSTSAKDLFRLAKPPIGYGPLIAGVIAFFILINIFNVFLTISLAIGIGAAFYFFLPSNRSRRLTNRAVGEELRGNGDEALTLLNKALRLNPKNTQARNLKGFILAGRGEHEAAVDELEKYFESAYDYNTAALLGRCYWKLGKTEKAIDILQQLPPDNPRHFGSIALLGKAYMRKGESQKAIEVLNQSLDSAKGGELGEIDIRYTLAEAFEAANKIDQAIAHYRIILEKRKGDKKATEGISRLSQNNLSK